MYQDYSIPRAEETDWWFPLQQPVYRVTDWAVAEKYIYLYLESLHGDLDKFYKELEKQTPKLDHINMRKVFCDNALASEEDSFPIRDILIHTTTKARHANDGIWASWMVARIAEKVKKRND